MDLLEGREGYRVLFHRTCKYIEHKTQKVHGTMIMNAVQNHYSTLIVN